MKLGFTLTEQPSTNYIKDLIGRAIFLGRTLELYSFLSLCWYTQPGVLLLVMVHGCPAIDLLP